MTTLVNSRFGLVCLFVIALVGDTSSSGRDQVYISTLEAFEGSIGCRAGLKGPSPGPMLSIRVQLKDPTGATLRIAEDWTYSTNVRVEFAVEPTVSGIYTCYGQFDVDGTTIENLVDQRQITLPSLPTSLTAHNDRYLWRFFNDYNREIHYQVRDQYENPIQVSGMQVTESYTKTSDTCNLPNIQTGTTTTNAQGMFRDNYLLKNTTGCAANPSCSATFEQTISVAGRVVRTNEVEYDCYGVSITPQ